MSRRSAAVAAATVVAIALATLVWLHLPVNTTIYGPFDVHAGIASRAVGQNLSATVTHASITPTVIAAQSRKRYAAAGVWVVVLTRLEAAREPVLPHADLLVGPNTYAPTTQLLSGADLVQPGITQQRTWAFDVPPDLLKTVPSVVMRVWGGDGRLDSRLVIDIPLAGIERPGSIVVPPSKVGAQ
ncbi:hypothetical protein [Mycolicibacterium aichiense]|uniref:Uncharacterized protein n=1 Tax=Mycolicibacterium aichiense TaxID=1799 RepID=A0AAD1MDI0_9MYCO|nr:hypothetical protein [Mycolicibacterium aichiense]MCV7019121.1 hypothetical protein [Mycolicibacterium aichiense]BBX08329.1 hypothetical protein MAIC_31320 [Mycolicibacterium aichiense]STZ82130.1 Uncharacterised protein [Mycolicibacterium aichiense]